MVMNSCRGLVSDADVVHGYVDGGTTSFMSEDDIAKNGVIIVPENVAGELVSPKTDGGFK